jgi:hypothetical protein
MRYDAQSLYALLPAVHRVRDAAEDGVLQELLTIVAEQLNAIEEDIDQLYDNLFIETCAKWAVPYLGGLIGSQLLHGAQGTLRTSRAEVANTIAYRRRKGTAAVLEQMARDVTGWDTAAVEYFLHLATTQYLNHLRPEHRCTADLRQMEPLERLGSAFDSLPHTVNVRPIASGRGRHNIPNVGLFLFRLGAHSWNAVRAHPAAAADRRRFQFHPLGINAMLFSFPEPEKEVSHLAGIANVPLPLSRRELSRRTADYYGPGKSIEIMRRTGATLMPVPVDEIESCDLSDLDADPDTSAWPPGHPTRISLDPQLGRIRFPADEEEVLVRFHTGFPARLGGGEYDRLATFDAEPVAFAVYPGAQASLEATIIQLGTAGTVEIGSSGPFRETPIISCHESAQLEVRAADGMQAVFQLGADLLVGGGTSAEVTLNGLLLTGGRVVVPATFQGHPNRLQKLRIVHCTLIPGISLHRDGQPVSPGTPGIVVECADTTVEIEWSICGGVRAVDTAAVNVANSIIDATSPDGTAFCAPPPNEPAPGAPLTFEGCTVIGKIHTAALLRGSNSLLLAENTAGDGWDAPVIASRRQQGCVRFSWLPLNSIVPRRYRCHPVDDAESVKCAPAFTSLRYGDAGYCQLATPVPDALWRGAADEAEVGVFHHLKQPQREDDLRTRLDEFLRFGLEAGLFHST